MARLSLLSMLVCLVGFTTAFVAPGAALRLSTQQPAAAAAAVTMMAKAPRISCFLYVFDSSLPHLGGI